MAINTISREIRDIHSLLLTQAKPVMRTAEDAIPRTTNPLPATKAKAKEPDWEFIIEDF